MYIQTYQPRDIIDGRYRVDALVGKGGFSYVYRVFDLRDQQGPYALKMIDSDPLHRQSLLASLNNEFNLLSRITHCKYVVRPLHIQNHTAPCYSVLSYIDGGNLKDYMEQHRGPLPEPFIARFLYQIGLALESCHNSSDPLVHLDLKPDNILLDRQENFYLSDFGTSYCESDLRQKPLEQLALTDNYAPPEVWDRQQPTHHADMFSLGITLYEMCTELRPNGALPLSRLLKYGQEDLPPIPDTYSKRLADLIDMMLQPNPPERPPASLVRSFGQHYLKRGFWMDPLGRSTTFFDADQPAPTPVQARTAAPPPPPPRVVKPSTRQNSTPQSRDIRQSPPRVVPSPRRVAAPPPKEVAQKPAANRRRLWRAVAATVAILVVGFGAMSFRSAQSQKFAMLSNETYADLDRREYLQAYQHATAAAQVTFYGTEGKELIATVKSESDRQRTQLQQRYAEIKNSPSPNFQLAEATIDSLRKCAVKNPEELSRKFAMDLAFEEKKREGMQEFTAGNYLKSKEILLEAQRLMKNSLTIQDPRLTEALQYLQDRTN